MPTTVGAANEITGANAGGRRPFRFSTASAAASLSWVVSRGMELFALIVVLYVALGVGLLVLSVTLARRIPAAALRLLIHSGVFAAWFSPGGVAGEGGAGPAPLWLAFLDSTWHLFSTMRTETGQYNPWPLHWWWQGTRAGIVVLGIVWGATFGVLLCVAGVRHFLRKNEVTS